MRKWKDGPTVQGGRRMFLKLLTAAGVVGGLALVPKPAAAQTTPGAAGGPRVSPAFTYRRLSKDEAAVLLVDHQSGLISLVQDYSPGEFPEQCPRLGGYCQVLPAADDPDHEL
jgi:hypothetical protein